MDKDKLQSLIKQTVNEVLLHESLANFEALHDGISTSTMTGNAWFKLISNLETVVDEVKDFKAQYSSARHGPLPNTYEAMVKLEQVVGLLLSIKPVIMAMDDIEKKDV